MSSVRNPVRGRHLPSDEDLAKQYQEVILKTSILVTVFILNYIHLEWTRKQAPIWSNRMLKLVLVILVPTYILAELIVDLFRVWISILRIPSDELDVSLVLAHARRYLCSLGGMRVAADPLEGAADLPVLEEGEPVPRPPAARIKPRPLLISIPDAADLREHVTPLGFLLPWRVLFVLAGSLVVAFLETRMDQAERHFCYGIDRRFVATTFGTVGCTVSALLIMLCRRSWSLQHLTTSEPAPEKPWRLFCGQMLIATLLYDIQMQGFPSKCYYEWPGPRATLLMFIIPSMSPFLILLIVVAVFMGSMTGRQVQQRTGFNWSLVFGIVMSVGGLFAINEQVWWLIEDFKTYDPPRSAWISCRQGGVCS